MIDSLCTIIFQPSEVIEGSTFDKLIKRFPYAAFHDHKNRIFNGTDPDAIDPIIVSDLKDDEGIELSGDALVVALAPALFADDRTQPIHIRKSVLSEVFNHPACRLFCGNYLTIEGLEVDYILVFSEDIDGSLTLEELVVVSRTKLETLFGA